MGTFPLLIMIVNVSQGRQGQKNSWLHLDVVKKVIVKGAKWHGTLQMSSWREAFLSVATPSPKNCIMGVYFQPFSLYLFSCGAAGLLQPV